MDPVSSILNRLADQLSSPHPDVRLQDELASLLLAQWKKELWFPSAGESWEALVLQQTLEQIQQRIADNVARMSDGKHHEIFLKDLADRLISLIFLTPEAVRLIYSSHPAIFEMFVLEGARHHCRLFRRAAGLAVRKHTAGLNRVFLNTQNLEEELWSVIMEELIRCLNDFSARIWEKGCPEPLLIPAEGTRGRRMGTLLRVALDPEGKWLAALRSDYQLFLWEIQSHSLLRSWDLAPYKDELRIDLEKNASHALYFSRSGVRLALEFSEPAVLVLNWADSGESIQIFEESERKEFFRVFGTPHFHDLPAWFDPKTVWRTRSGCTQPAGEYLQNVYDWSSGGKYLTTASELERSMPNWMQKAGLERAVYHIAKMRLIDLIRKHTHTNYACWRCGSMSSSWNDTHCRKCGVNFSRCPLGCDKETLTAANQWQCPQCGTASRTLENQVQVELADWSVEPQLAPVNWQDEHNMERILATLKKRSVAYKRKEIPCDRLAAMKADGKTNEEIGRDLGIPRGSVDYIWNQCKQHILEAIGEI